MSSDSCSANWTPLGSACARLLDSLKQHWPDQSNELKRGTTRRVGEQALGTREKRWAAEIAGVSMRLYKCHL